MDNRRWAHVWNQSFPSPWSLLVWLLPSKDLFSLGDPSSSLATADIALWVGGAHKPTHHDRWRYQQGAPSVKQNFYTIAF
ncbi:hypothetical protein TNIN_13251 [Trichonephila inaurata madagascariensis]|uniref:Uncharacterized protein n=1 Tax=Trichonephila inaurata madagascariensis TaxID=2747483 RepID=A0A8X6YSV2_9ARAC|nr:hypothetical protein TNIN_13251 [Trichonephila inaurata madagascariensis]